MKINYFFQKFNIFYNKIVLLFILLMRKFYDTYSIEKKVDSETGFVFSEQHFLNGKLHRLDGPAKVTKMEDNGYILEEWFKNGKLHREGGKPARKMWIEGSGVISLQEYFIEGSEIVNDSNNPVPS